MWIMWISPVLGWIYTLSYAVYSENGGFLNNNRRIAPDAGKAAYIHAYILHIHASARIA